MDKSLLINYLQQCAIVAAGIIFFGVEIVRVFVLKKLD